MKTRYRTVKSIEPEDTLTVKLTKQLLNVAL